MRRDYFVNFVLWIAAFSGAVMLMALPGLVMDPAHYTLWLVCFAVGLGIMIALLIVAGVAAFGDKGETKKLKSERKMIPLIGMIVSGLFLGGFSISFFWPQKPASADFQCQITAVAAFDVPGQPGLVNVIPVVNVQNLQQHSNASITGYILKLQFPDGTDLKATAQAVFDPVTFGGINGSVELNSGNTLWGKNGSPPITSFLSGRLWFPFEGIKDLSNLANPETKLTLVVLDSSGKSNSATVQIADLNGPRIINLINPPAALPTSPKP